MRYKASFFFGFFFLILMGMGDPARKPFAGANSYSLWARTDQDIIETLDLMKKNNLSVLRVFFLASGKDLNGNRYSADVEDPVGVYRDRILERMDFLIAEARQRKIRLIVALHDRWSLGYWQTDAYAKANPEKEKGKPNHFYTDPKVRKAFKARLRHILNHRNNILKKTWKNLGDVIFAWELENEAYAPPHLEWVEEMAGYVKSIDSRHRVCLGGWEVRRKEIPEVIKALRHVDLFGLHWYGTFNLGRVAAELEKVAKGRWFIEEFGVKRKEQARRGRKVYKEVIDVANRYKVGWIFWELSRDRREKWHGIWKKDALLGYIRKRAHKANEH